MARPLHRAAALLKATYEEWKGDNAMMLAAAVAFYATFSIAPLLVLIVTGGSLLFGEESAQRRLLDFVSEAIGARAAQAVGRLVLAASETDAGATTVSIVLLVLAASAVFRHLRIALNIVFDVPTREESGMLRFVKSRLFAALAVVIGIVLLLSALGMAAALAWWRENAPQPILGASFVWRATELLASFAVLAVVFATILKFVPDIALKWRSVATGALLAAFVFTGGQQMISLYVARASLTTVYGAAGSIVLILVYIYFAVAVLLAAAELTEILAREDREFRQDRRRLQDGERFEPQKSDQPA